jgi:hypothetical protein
MVGRLRGFDLAGTHAGADPVSRGGTLPVPSDWAIVTAGAVGVLPGAVLALTAERRAARAATESKLHSVVIDFITEALAATSLPSGFSSRATRRFADRNPAEAVAIVLEMQAGLRPLYRAKSTLDLLVPGGPFHEAADEVLAAVRNSIDTATGGRPPTERATDAAVTRLQRARLVMIRETEAIVPTPFGARRRWWHVWRRKGQFGNARS